MTEKSTVRSVTYDLLRSLGLTTVFGNPGSTEETFLQEFPDDFSYVLALQEASAIAMADAFAQVTRRPALVNLHSSAGVGNAMGNLVAAYHGNTPLIVTAGQQQRELMIGEPYLGNREATTMPKPWVKWSYEPYRAEDVPEAFMRAYAMALQPPAGPVFLSVPLDDWNQPLAGPARVRTVSTGWPRTPSACGCSPTASPPAAVPRWSSDPRWTALAGGTRPSPWRRSCAPPSTEPRWWTGPPSRRTIPCSAGRWGCR